MSCPGIVDYLVRETGRYLPGEVFRRGWGKFLWMSLLPRGQYPLGLSQTINTLTTERNAPTSAEPEWKQVQVIDGTEGGTCLPVPEVVDFGTTTRNFTLFERNIQGPDFCASDQISVFSLTQQLNGIHAALAGRINWEWDIHNRAEYVRMVQNKVIVNDCFNPTVDTNASGLGYPAGIPTQTMSMGLLDNWKFQLLRDGAADSAMLMQNGQGVLTVIADPETIGGIIRQNSELRQDIRWAEAGEGNGARLMKQFGINNTYNGYAFIGDIYGRRFNNVGGVLVQVPNTIRVAAGKGFKSIMNPAWRTAQFAETIIWDQSVMRQLVAPQITNPAPDFVFNPVNYVGDIQVLNIPDRRCNPRQQILFHDVLMRCASLPMETWKGVSFIHLRCDPSCGAATSCTS